MLDRWVRYAIGYVFITSSIMKLLISDFKMMFANYGIPFPATTLFIVAILEIGCGALIIANMHIKKATVPLIIIMIGALYLTKVPILLKQGMLQFAFDARLDMIMLILLLLIGGHLPRRHAAT